MLVPAGSTIFFLREHRFAVRCRVVTLRQLLWTLFTLLFMLSTCLLHIFLYIFFINIGCATLYYLSMMYVTVYIMSFNSIGRGAKLQVYQKLFHFLSSYQNCKLAEVVLESRMKIAAIECVGRTGVTGIPLFSLDVNENFTFEAFYCGSQYLFLEEIRKLSVFHSIFSNLSDDR